MCNMSSLRTHGNKILLSYENVKPHPLETNWKWRPWAQQQQKNTKEKLWTSLVSRPSHVFQRMREKSGRPGSSGDVIGCSLRCGCISPPTHPCNGHGLCHMTNCVGEWAEILCNHCIRLHHQIDQAFPIFLRMLKNMGRPGYERLAMDKWEE